MDSEILCKWFYIVRTKLKDTMSLIEDSIKRINNRKYISVAVAILILYLSPLFILGQDARILIQSNLDSNVVSFKMLAESGQIFGSLDATIPNIMNGLPRNCLGSEFNVILWLYYLLEPFTAYVVNITVMHFIAFIGMYLLLKNHFLRDEKYEIIIVGAALCFALLPFWPPGGLSIVGQPLALYAFLNIRGDSSTKKDWLILLLIPFYSSFIASFLFFLFVLGMLWIYDTAKTKRINYPFFIAIALMTSIFAIVEYRLIYNMFLNSGYVSHRVEFGGGVLSGVATGVGTIEAIGISVYNFIFGQHHAVSLQQYFVGLSVAAAIITVFVKKLREDLLIILLTITAAISIFYGFWVWDALQPLKDQIALFNFNTFNLSRFHWLHPLLWYTIFALSLKVIFDNRKYGKQIVLILLILQAGFLFSYDAENVQSGGIGIVQRGGLSYEEFFSEDLFLDIANYIGNPQANYRVVSIGLHPGIAQYNGFYTLDSTEAPNYPLEYKHEFRRIIEKELDKNDELRSYFDNWGSRCYIFVDELGKNYLITKDKEIKVNNLELNSDALKRMGGNYVISAVEITNSDDNNLKLLKTFENDRSPWKIWLYKIE